MSDLPPSDGEERAPFRLPGLPVEGMRREGSALRVARAAWSGARDVGVGGVEFLRTREPVREVVRREFWELAFVMVRSCLGTAVGLVAVGAIYALHFGLTWAGLAAAVEVTLVCAAVGVFFVGASAVMLVVILVATLASALLGVVLGWLLAVGGVLLAAPVAAFGAASRELGREVARRAYDAKVRRKRLRMRAVSAEEGACDQGRREDAPEGCRTRRRSRPGGLAW